MRAYRKRPWSTLAVNMTPLIDVVFLIIIFFIIIINFSEMHILKVNLPKADEAHTSRVKKKLVLPIIIKADGTVLVNRKKTGMESLSRILKKKRSGPEIITAQIRADETVPYEKIKEVLKNLAVANMNRIEFSTMKDEPEPLEELDIL